MRLFRGLVVWILMTGALRAEDVNPEKGTTVEEGAAVSVATPRSENPAELPADVLAAKQALAGALEEPMANGMDVEAALECWFAAERLTEAADLPKRKALYAEGVEKLRGIKALPRATWPAVPTNVTLRDLGTLGVRDMPDGTECRVVMFTVTGLQQFGVVVQPRTVEGKANGPYPLLVWAHGAAYGVPVHAIAWMGTLAAQGYVIAAPAMRGEPLFAGFGLSEQLAKIKCAGMIEDLKGEPDDILGMVDGVMKWNNVKKGKYAILGHSFGAGAGLLAAARTDQVACVIAYDAWFVNAFRFYWQRLSGGSMYYWMSYENYTTTQSEAEQLAGLMTRSIAHHADRIKCPVLLFTGGGYNSAGYRQSFDDLVTALKAQGTQVQYEIVPEGSHNFVLYYDSEPALAAMKLQMRWLEKYIPGVPPPPPAAPAPVKELDPSQE